PGGPDRPALVAGTADRRRRAARGHGKARPGAFAAVHGGAHGRRLRAAVRPPARGEAGGGVRFVIFCHSLVSDWNHGNAHFLRGVCSELIARGHAVDVYEPKDAWSRVHLEAEHGAAPLIAFARAYPELASRRFELATLDLDDAPDDA